MFLSGYPVVIRYLLAKEETPSFAVLLANNFHVQVQLDEYNDHMFKE